MKKNEKIAMTFISLLSAIFIIIAGFLINGFANSVDGWNQIKDMTTETFANAYSISIGLLIFAIVLIITAIFHPLYYLHKKGYLKFSK